MEKLREQAGDDVDISPDKYTFNTVIHAYAKSGAKESATKAHRILDNMNQMYREGNSSVKPDTITVRLINILSAIEEVIGLWMLIGLNYFSNLVQCCHQCLCKIWR